MYQIQIFAMHAVYALGWASAQINMVPLPVVEAPAPVQVVPPNTVDPVNTATSDFSSGSQGGGGGSQGGAGGAGGAVGSDGLQGGAGGSPGGAGGSQGGAAGSPDGAGGSPGGAGGSQGGAGGAGGPQGGAGGAGGPQGGASAPSQSTTMFTRAGNSTGKIDLELDDLHVNGAPNITLTVSNTGNGTKISIKHNNNNRTS